jgi:hypothetical protein
MAEQQIIPTDLPAFRMYLFVFLMYLKNMYRSWLGTFRFSYTPDSGTMPEFNQVRTNSSGLFCPGGGGRGKSQKKVRPVQSFNKITSPGSTGNTGS